MNKRAAKKIESLNNVIMDKNYLNKSISPKRRIELPIKKMTMKICMPYFFTFNIVKNNKKNERGIYSNYENGRRYDSNYSGKILNSPRSGEINYALSQPTPALNFSYRKLNRDIDILPSVQKKDVSEDLSSF